MTENGFNRCNQVSGIYWLKHPIEDLKFKITVQTVNEVLKLPQIDDYILKSDSEQDAELPSSEYKESLVVHWQEKCFSRREISLYSESRNCHEKYEKDYHRTIKDLTEEQMQRAGRLFTYVDRDSYAPEPVLSHGKSWDLNQRFGGLSLDNLGFENSEPAERNETDIVYGRSEEILLEPTLQNLRERMVRRGGDDEETTMFVMLDVGQNESLEDGYHRELCLVALRWCDKRRRLCVRPDLGTTCHVRMDHTTYSYYIETANEDPPEEELEAKRELENMMVKAVKRFESKMMMSFSLPPRGVTRRHLTLEICWARGFEYDDLCVRYAVRTSGGAPCAGAAGGRTHVARINAAGVANFSHVVEFVIDHQDGQCEMLAPTVHLSVLSVDGWGVTREEGACEWRGGAGEALLRCVRARESPARRFFVGSGDCDAAAMTTAPELSDGHKASMLHTRTERGGELCVRARVLLQRTPSRAACLCGACEACESGARPRHDGALMAGVRAALRGYRRARRRLRDTCDENTGSEGEGTGDHV